MGLGGCCWHCCLRQLPSRRRSNAAHPAIKGKADLPSWQCDHVVSCYIDSFCFDYHQSSKLYADQHVIRCKNTYTPSDVIGGLRRRHHCFCFYPQTGPALGTRRTNPTTTVRQCSIYLASERTSNMDACGLLLHGRVAIRSIIRSIHQQQVRKHDRDTNSETLGWLAFP